MDNLEEQAEKELELEFYGFVVEELITEVKGGLEDTINAAIDDSKKKIAAKFGSKNPGDFEVVRKKYAEALEKHNDGLESLIKEAFRIPCSTELLKNEGKLDESTIDKEINELRLKSLALDVYKRMLIRLEDELQVVADCDTSGLRETYENIDASTSMLEDNFKLASQMITQAGKMYHMERSFRNNL